MIQFHKLTAAQKEQYEEILFSVPQRSCEYAFANLFLWGRQQVAFLHGCVAFFSHFNGKSVYPYPIGKGDKRKVVQLVLEDARERGIPCRFTGMNEEDMAQLENWFPGRFIFNCDRDSFDYVYEIHTLADLKGKKLQKKRNHVNRFRAQHPDYRVEPLSCANIDRARHMVNDWYQARMKADPQGNYLLENIAMAKAFRYFEELEMEGLVLLEGDAVLAVTMGSRLSEDTFDIHFEKAREDVDGAYPAINCEFARHLRLKYPQVRFLDREDDMGLEGLRKAKLSYYPHHLAEKCWAYEKEDIYDDQETPF